MICCCLLVFGVHDEHTHTHTNAGTRVFSLIHLFVHPSLIVCINNGIWIYTHIYAHTAAAAAATTTTKSRCISTSHKELKYKRNSSMFMQPNKLEKKMRRRALLKFVSEEIQISLNSLLYSLESLLFHIIIVYCTLLHLFLLILLNEMHLKALNI